MLILLIMLFSPVCLSILTGTNCLIRGKTSTLDMSNTPRTARQNIKQPLDIKIIAQYFCSNTRTEIWGETWWSQTTTNIWRETWGLREPDDYKHLTRDLRVEGARRLQTSDERLGGWGSQTTTNIWWETWGLREPDDYKHLTRDLGVEGTRRLQKSSAVGCSIIWWSAEDCDPYSR
jgi:hypothetical protein